MSPEQAKTGDGVNGTEGQIESTVYTSGVPLSNTASPTTISQAARTAAGEPEVAIKPAAAAQDLAGNADVLYVVAKQETGNKWHFSVTVEHPDIGWEDYADGWNVVLPDGAVAKADPDSPFTRLLLHPHESEQPFTRSQGGIVIAPGIDIVTVRAHDSVSGFGGREVAVDLRIETGEDFEVTRQSE